MEQEEYLEKLRALLREGRHRDSIYPVKSIIEIDQGGNPKDGILLIDGKEVTFISRFTIDLDLNGAAVKLNIERILPAHERINAVLHDVDAEIKTVCPMCGSEKIERNDPVALYRKGDKPDLTRMRCASCGSPKITYMKTRPETVLCTVCGSVSDYSAAFRKYCMEA